MQIYLKNILVTTMADGPNTKVVSELNDIILKEQTIAEVSELMTDNLVWQSLDPCLDMVED